MKEHLKDLSELIPAEETLYIMDRGYFSADLFEVIDTAGAKFLIRCPVGTCHAIDDAATEDFVSLENNQVVKVIKLVLDSGEIEVLATNLFDLDEYDAYDLYHLRWNIEENFKIIKSHLHLECFNGCSETVVRQEFYAVLINNLLLSAVAEQADQQIKQKKKNRYRYQANRNRCAQAIRRNLVALLTETDEETIEKIYDGMFRQALRDTVPVRPGRNTPRKNKRAVRFHMNIRYI